MYRTIKKKKKLSSIKYNNKMALLLNNDNVLISRRRVEKRGLKMETVKNLIKPLSKNFLLRDNRGEQHGGGTAN